MFRKADGLLDREICGLVWYMALLAQSPWVYQAPGEARPRRAAIVQGDPRRALECGG